MKKGDYRIVHYTDSNGDNFYRIERKYWYLFWVNETREEYYGLTAEYILVPVEFKSISECTEYVDNLITTYGKDMKAERVKDRKKVGTFYLTN